MPDLKKNELFPFDENEISRPAGAVRAFSDAEMIFCGRCRRKNPPDRAGCLYCGNDLAQRDGVATRSRARAVESWEPAFNVIISGVGSVFETQNLTRLSDLTGIEQEILRVAIDTRSRFPALRFTSEREAAICSAGLAQAGVNAAVVADTDLVRDRPPRRCRGLAIDERSLKISLHGDDQAVETSGSAIRIIVSGFLFEKRVDVERRRERGKMASVELGETFSETPVLDFYIAGDAIGYRISSVGFDFSCLGAEKQMLAAANLSALSRRLQAIAGTPAVDESYRPLRAVLDRVWPLTEQKLGGEMKRIGIGRVKFSGVVVDNNAGQFTKYSRLCAGGALIETDNATR